MRGHFYFIGNYHSTSVQVYHHLREQMGQVEKISHSGEVKPREHNKKFVFIFSNAKEALEFLSKGELPKMSFFALITEREGVFKKKEALKTFEALNLNFYTPKVVNKLLEDIDHFLLDNLIKPEEIEFNVRLALED